MVAAGRLDAVLDLIVERLGFVVIRRTRLATNNACEITRDVTNQLELTTHRRMIDDM